MNIKYDVIVNVWLGQIVVTGCEVEIVLFIQIKPNVVWEGKCNQMPSEILLRKECHSK